MRAIPENAGDSNAMTLSERMAEPLAALAYDALSVTTVEKAKLCLIDYFASAFVSPDLPWGRQAVRSAARSSGNCTIVGAGVSAAPGDAAFANAVLGHGLVRDDMHLGSVSHLGVVAIPPALAIAESQGTSGRDLLTAIVAGYEAGSCIGRAILDVDVARIFRPTGITGPVAAAAATARLHGADTETFATALSIAGNTALGYNEWAATGGSEMFFHTGFAARNGVTATFLALEGAYASRTALDGPAGLLAAFDKLGHAGRFVPFTGEPEIAAVFFKEVPACNFAQTAAQAARALALANAIDPDAIASVRVYVPHAAAAYPGCDAPGPFAHVLQAKMSIHYNVASALLTRSFDEAHYVPADNPRTTALARSIELFEDAALTSRFPSAQGAAVEVTLRDGATLRFDQNDVLAADEDTVNARFDAAASARIGRANAQRLRELIHTLDSQPDIGELMRIAGQNLANTLGRDSE